MHVLIASCLAELSCERASKSASQPRRHAISDRVTFDKKPLALLIEKCLSAEPPKDKERLHSWYVHLLDRTNNGYHVTCGGPYRNQAGLFANHERESWHLYTAVLLSQMRPAT